MTVRDTVQHWHDESDATRFRDLGVWQDRNIPELVDQWAQERPDKLALVDGHVRWSYAELVDHSLRAAQVLLDLGVSEGEAVATQVPSSGLLPLLHLATNRIGAIFVPLSTTWRGAELEPLLATTQASVLFVPGATDRFDYKAMVDGFASELEHLQHVVTVRDGGADSFDALVEAASPADPAILRRRRPSPDAPLHAMSTSGTTGIPKVSVYSGNNLYALLVKQYGTSVGQTDSDVSAGIAPANTGSTGYIFPILAPLIQGATTVILEEWDPQAAVELIERERCTIAVAIPTQLVMLLDLPLEQHDVTPLRAFSNAGAPLAPSVAADIEKRMGCCIQTVYGATDGGVPVCTSIDDPEDKRLTTVGRLQAGEEIRLLGLDDQPVPSGDAGEVTWRGANKSYGYLNQPDNDAVSWDDEGYFRSGDLGQFDQAGYLSIVGRAKDMILRGGYNIFPAEVEHALFEHGKVAEVSVVGVPDTRLGERACAVIVPSSGGEPPQLEELTDFLTERGLAKYKLPEFLVVMDALPRNAGGKVDKPTVREHAVKHVQQG